MNNQMTEENVVDEMEIINIDGVDCYEKDGVAYLRLENVARGLGFTTVATSGNEVIRWNRVKKYLADFGVIIRGDEKLPDFVPENVFYRLAMKAKNETAEAFQALVADKIIPSIRKNGAYIAGQETLSDEALIAKALVVARRVLKEREERIQILKVENAAMQPKALFADSVSTAKTSILIGELAKILKQNGVQNMGQNRMFQWMRDNGFLIKRQGTDFNMPTQYSMERGLFEIKETAVTHSDGHVTVTKTPKVTGKGQIYFVNRFLGDEDPEKIEF